MEALATKLDNLTVQLERLNSNVDAHLPKAISEITRLHSEIKRFNQNPYLKGMVFELKRFNDILLSIKKINGAVGVVQTIFGGLIQQLRNQR